ncbi:MAG TPA: response regulator [Arenimonas sp.]|nr:response regulator [Arenimonas sp.]HOZ04153.1 response regulator [Arenimonas sp.]HPO23134.1 response regulator [Arenimonas sp.]HPW31923.1 response regulator [Arenimonas sp.]
MSEPAGASVLIIDDEAQIRRFLGISLRAQGYEVLEAENGAAGLEMLASRGADAVILDLGLPDLDGHEVLRELRAWSSVPVIVLSVRSGEAEKVKALDAGANDYVTKPFGVQELSARLRALLRLRPEEDQAAVFDDGILKIDLARRQITRNGDIVTLTRKEWSLLNLLMRHTGRVLTQPQLLRELWGPTHEEDTHYLRILVAKLRTKLGDNAAAPRYIQTEAGVGLRFISSAEP